MSKLGDPSSSQFKSNMIPVKFTSGVVTTGFPGYCIDIPLQVSLMFYGAEVCFKDDLFITEIVVEYSVYHFASEIWPIYTRR